MVRTKLIGLASAFVFAGLQASMAADMPTKAPPPIAFATPWTGFYVNGGIGYGAWTADQTVLVGAGPACVTCVVQYQGGKGWLGTIGLGYDYQLMSKVVVGVFGDYSLSSLEGTIQDGQPFFTAQIKETSSWAVGARIGLLAGPKTLGYVNGGYTGARFSGADLVSSITGAPVGLSTQPFTANGWFLGGGTEIALSPGWFWRTEYRYSYYGSQNLPELTAAGAVINTFVFKPTVQSVTTQLVYKFNGGLPSPSYAPVSEIAAKWTGLYVNAGYGYGLWSAQENSVSPATGLCTICVVQTQGGKGYLATFGAGYDWQFAPQWLVGAFGDVEWSSLKGTLQDHGVGLPTALSGDIKQTFAWAVGPRFGWLITPGTLAYVNGGYTSARFSGVTMLNIVTTAPTGGSTQAFTTNGWFVGGGIETAFDLFGILPPGFFLRSEYRYASYANKTLVDAPGAFDSINFKPVVQSVTSSLVFKLN